VQTFSMSASLFFRIKQNDKTLTCLNLSLQDFESQSYGSVDSWRKAVLDGQVSKWAHALANNTHIQEIDFNFTSCNGTLWDRHGLLLLLQAAGACSSLKKLVFHLRFDYEFLQCQSCMAKSIQVAENIQDLELSLGSTLSGTDAGFEELVKAIQHHPKLESLKLTRRLQRGSDAIVTILDNSSIKKVSLAVGTEITISFIQALGTNASLETLEMAVPSNIHDDHLELLLMELTKALEKNQTLQNVSLVSIAVPYRDNGPGDLHISKESSKALVSVLKNKYNLYALNVFGQHIAGVDFYTKLNRAGRKELLRTDIASSARDWVDILSTVPDDIACLYYFLQSNPSLCTE